MDAIHTYDSVLEKYERWAEIEQRLLEMDKKIAELKRAKSNACMQNLNHKQRVVKNFQYLMEVDSFFVCLASRL